MIRAGETYGRLTAIEPTATKQKGEFKWRFRCTCGRVVVVKPSHARSNAKVNGACAGCFFAERIEAHAREARTILGVNELRAVAHLLAALLGRAKAG